MTAVNEMCRSGQHSLAEVGVDGHGACKACADEARSVRVESRVGRMRRLFAETQEPRPGWQADAKCGGEDPTNFLSVDGRGQSADVIANRNLLRHNKAKQVCSLCPVKKDCGGFVLLGFLRAGVKQYGTWSGEFFAEADWTAAAQAKKEMASE